MSARIRFHPLRAACAAGAVITAIALAPLAHAASASTALEPHLEITWQTVDTGGAISAGGGALALSGTAGQPDAGALGGSGLTLRSGFWGGLAWGQTFVADTRRVKPAVW